MIISGKHIGLEEVKSLWKAIRHKDISKEARYFLWMTFHDAYMVGSNWLRPGYVPEYQERSECKQCHKTESMEHILTECNAPGQAVIWSLAEEMWKKRNQKWPKPTLGIILASPNMRLTSRKDTQDSSARLYRILMTESAHLIWKLRCERVIREESPPSTTEVRKRWKYAITARADLDKKMTNPRYGKKALDESLVENTWVSLLQDENKLPDLLDQWALGF